VSAVIASIERAREPAAGHWPLLVALQQRSQQARDEAELGFLIANDTWHLVPYTQACVFLPDAIGRLPLRFISGLGNALEETPFTLWVQSLRDAAAQLAHDKGSTGALPFDASDLPEPLREGWLEWWPAHALLLPLTTPAGRSAGCMLLARDEPWADAELATLAMLAGSFAYCLEALRGQRRSWRERLLALRRRPGRLAVGGAVLVAALFCPVRMSVLAPAEIIAMKAEAVAAPMDGVIKEFQVQPNQPVKQGQLLYTLDDTTLLNRREVATQALAVARADALAAQQKAFDSAQSKADLATLQGRVQEREADLAFIEQSLTRIQIRAAHDGVFVYGDPNDWIGKPVATGERIAQLASPDALGVTVWLPVADAINLEPGAPIRLYLQVAPLDALSGELVQTSYQASLSPDGVASYRIRGSLAAGERAHIGLRGVAKVYGDWQPAIYWLLRRPLGALRQWVGL
jgi:hypothetical protein